ncbi:hypothetical protein [Emticicia sp. SJ17W-69]|uniref:hypothetical protein n=1 Tax=Emticicia sp. SJ17W-69 TaxID=3421657 RepID=UPI003EBA633E
MKNKHKIFQKVIMFSMVIVYSFVSKAQTNCDYNSSNITFNIGTAGVLPSNSLTSYLLVDHNTGIINQISSTQGFTGITQSKTYDIYAFSYINDNTVTGLFAGGLLSSLTASCSDLSNPLTVSVCLPSNNGQCDFTTSSFTLNPATPPPTDGTTQYILTNINGTILQIASTPTFSGFSGTQSFNVFAVSYTGNISNLAIGNNYNTITGSCFDLSNPFPVNVCVCKPICLPVVLTKIK